MARKFLVPIDMNKLEIQNQRVHVLAAAPSSPVSGQVYYDSVTNKLYYWNGGAWVAADGTSLFATPAITLGTAHAAGSAATTIRSDATILAFDATAPTTLAVGGAAAVGAATVAARRDHAHGMPAFGNVTTATAYAQASSNGAATTVARSDHNHGTPAHTGTEHSTISISSLSNPTADRPWGGFKITGLGDPTAAQDAATKAYVDATAQGLDIKGSVRVATTANITLSGEQAIDGITTNGTRVLVKNQTAPAENGIYVSAAGAWVRATDADTNADVNSGLFVFVEEGTAHADTGWVLTTNNPITLGTTGLTFTQFSGAGAYTAGAGLTQSGTTFNVGAGTGITVNADDVAINAAVVVRKYAASVGDGAATSFVLTHNLNTQDVIVAVRDNASPFAFVEADMEATTVNTVTVRFAVAPTASQYRVIVHA